MGKVSASDGSSMDLEGEPVRDEQADLELRPATPGEGTFSTKKGFKWDRSTIGVDLETGTEGDPVTTGDF